MSTTVLGLDVLEYPKTQNLYNRCPETKKCLPELGFQNEHFSQISEWQVLEKLDGMNMRVVFEPREMNSVRI